MQLTSYEHIMRIFKNEEIDSPALKLWGAAPNTPLLHPAYQPVHELACSISDLFVYAALPFNIYYGKNSEQYIEKTYTDTDSPLWKDMHTVFHTPNGDLHGIERISTVGEPSYTTEHLIKEPEDIKKIMSIKYEPYTFSDKAYINMQNELGDRGVTMFKLDHAAYAMQQLIGSENLAYFSIDCRDELKELIRTCVEQGNKSGRFILCPSSGYIEIPFPTKRNIDNLMLYLNYGYDCVESCRK